MTTPSSSDKDFQDLTNRVRGSIWGQLVGDAYCLGTHWIYDLDELQRTFPGGIRGFGAYARPLPCGQGGG